MKRNTAIQLLRLLSKEEITKLGKFLRSPYFNNSKPIIALFDELRKRHPGYKEKHIRPRKFWEKIHPEKTFSEQQYWWLVFKLRTLIERFMIAEEMSNNQQAAKQQLTNAYSQRNAHRLFEKETKSLIEEIENQPHQDIHSYSKSLWLKHNYFFNPQTDKYGGATYSVEDAMDDLDRFYLLAKLRLASEIKNRERIFAKKVPIRLLVESIAESGHFVADNPAFLMYRNVLDLYDPEKAESAFQSGKELLGHQFSLLSKHDQNEVMLNLRNYAIRQLNKGRTEFWKEIFELYKLGLKLDLIVDDGKISDSAFGNIVKSGCKALEFDWVEQFINDYEKHLDKDVREDAKVISLGVLNFEKRDFYKTIKLIEQHNFTQLLYQQEARILAIKAWFEEFIINKDLFNLLSHRIEAAEKLYRRNSTISEQNKQALINFTLASKNLVDLIYQRKNSNEIKNRMKNYFNDKEHIASKRWLLEMISKL